MNLKGEIGKTHVTKAMTQLAADEVITCKTYGKQQVYCARQVQNFYGTRKAPPADNYNFMQDELDCPTAEALKVREL